MIIHLQDPRRQAADLLGKVQHLCAGVPLLVIGMGKLARKESDWPFAILEVAIGAVIIVSFLREAHGAALHKTRHSRLGWFDIAAGVMLIFEAFHGPHARPGYMRPQFLAGSATLLIGLFHERLQARRRILRLDENGVKFKPSRFRGFTLKWKDVASVELARGDAVFICKDGRLKTIPLHRFDNREEIRGAIAEHAREAGLQIAGELVDTPPG